MTDEALIARLAIKHSVSTDAVRTVLRGLRSGGGRMAQFSHTDFGGMSQWSPGMTMVGDMFNNELKAKLDAICTELASHVADAGSRPDKDDGRDGAVSYRSAGRGDQWWPAGLGAPSSVGAQNALRYAPCFRRLGGWRSRTASMSPCTTPAITGSSASRRRRAMIRRSPSPA
jgi:hypothetical protein